MSTPIETPVEGISDDVIRLRLRTDADNPAIIAACRDPDIVRFTRVPESYDESTAAEWAAESKRQREAGTGLHLVAARSVISRDCERQWPPCGDKLRAVYFWAVIPTEEDKHRCSLRLNLVSQLNPLS